MNYKKLAVSSALALMLLLGLMVFGGRKAQAASTWFVSPTGAPTGTSGGSCSNPSFNTISLAIAAASSGDTIQVCAGKRYSKRANRKAPQARTRSYSFVDIQLVSVLNVAR